MDTTRTIHLLVVEDSPAYMYLIKKAFSSRNDQIRWDLTAASDGEQAVQILFEEEREGYTPDLIILDWNLPKLNGGEVLRRVKQHAELRRIPVHQAGRPNYPSSPW
jgi:CheY-like chemotaxis protein